MSWDGISVTIQCILYTVNVQYGIGTQSWLCSISVYVLVNMAADTAGCFCCSCVAAAFCSYAAVMCVQICGGINSELNCRCE